MGINDLWEVLKDQECGRKVPLSELRDVIRVDLSARLAIDAYIIYYKYFCVAWTYMVQGNNFSIEHVIADCIKKIHDMCAKLTENGLEQIWCTDGDRSSDKLATDRRKAIGYAKIVEIAKMHQTCSLWCERNKLDAGDYPAILSHYDFLKDYWTRNISEVEPPVEFDIVNQVAKLKTTLSRYPIIPKDMMRIMREELEKRGHKFLSVPSIPEGEKLCSITVRLGFCQAVLSSDSDLIPMCTRMIIKEIKDEVAHVFLYSEILIKLGITYRQLMSYCIMLGNDFNDGIVGMAKVKCLQEVMKPEFNIYDFDRSRGGPLRVNNCLQAFTISEQECELIEQEITRRFCQ